MEATKTTEQNHAYQNAQGWAGTIAELVAALECDYDRLEELREEREALADQLADANRVPNLRRHNAAKKELAAWDAENAEELADLTATATIDGELYASADDVRERIQEGPLSVEVRSGWYSPGDTPEPEEFAILLSTGGPALCIRGELNGRFEPCRAWLEYQDWGTPWTKYHSGAGEGCDQQTLLMYCQQFCFRE